MTMRVEKNIRILEPSQGKWLKNGDSYSDLVFLGRNADPSEWTEVDEKPADEEPIIEEE